MAYKALPNRVLVSDFQRGERKIGGIILPNDDGKSTGIRSRWAQIHDVGLGVTDVSVGDWVLIQHGRWTRGVEIQEGEETFTVWQIDYPNGILAVSDQPTDTFNSEQLVQAEQLQR